MKDHRRSYSHRALATMTGRCQSWRSTLGRFSVHVERSIIEVPGALAEESIELPLPLRIMPKHKMNNGDCAIE